MIGYDTDEIIQELLDSLLHKYQIGLEQSEWVAILFLIMFQICIVCAKRQP